MPKLVSKPAPRRSRWRLTTQLLLSQLAVLLVVAAAGTVPAALIARQVIVPERAEIVLLAGVTGIALLAGMTVSLLLIRRLKRATFGLEVEDIAPMLSQVERMAASRESLRRVATLVAGGESKAAVISAVAEEAARVTDADAARVYRYAADGSPVLVAAWRDGAGRNGARGDGTGGDGAGAQGPVQNAPIVVNGRTWGRIVVISPRVHPVGSDVDDRVTAFAELAAAAISNVQARAELAASRRRVVTAADEARRRIERDLHDGTQQRLVRLGLWLRHAYDSCPGPPELRDQLWRMTQELTSMLDELREISQGVHPAILSQAGLRPALRSLARRASLPVGLRVGVAGRLPEPLEVAAYYVVSEALANAAKHSGASTAEVAVTVREGMLDVRVSDDGVGGADEARGSGLVGLRDRVEALGGTMTVASPPDGGTAIRAEFPLAEPGDSPAAEPGDSPAM